MELLSQRSGVVDQHTYEVNHFSFSQGTLGTTSSQIFDQNAPAHQIVNLSLELCSQVRRNPAGSLSHWVTVTGVYRVRHGICVSDVAIKHVLIL